MNVAEVQARGRAGARVRQCERVDLVAERNGDATGRAGLIDRVARLLVAGLLNFRDREGLGRSLVHGRRRERPVALAIGVNGRGRRTVVDRDGPVGKTGLPWIHLTVRVGVEVLGAAQHGCDRHRRFRRLDLERVVLAIAGIDGASWRRQLADPEDVNAAFVRGVVVRHQPDHVRVEVMAS